MDWLTVVLSAVVSLVSAGGIGWIITAKEDKKAKELDNVAKEFDIQEHKKDEIVQDWKDISNERKERAEELSIALKESEQRVRDKEKVITELRTQLDSKNTFCAVYELLRCNDLSCDRRQPPFSSSITVSNTAVDKLLHSAATDVNKEK